jgi:hypothetical protein
MEIHLVMTKDSTTVTSLVIHLEMKMEIHLVNHSGIPKVIHLEMMMESHLVNQKEKCLVTTKVKWTEIH